MLCKKAPKVAILKIGAINTPMPVIEIIWGANTIEKIVIKYDVIKCEKDFCVIKATNDKLETFGSALKGDFKTGNCNSWYVMEMAEKRALSRLVLKTTGFYELGVFGEDESEDFKKQ